MQTIDVTNKFGVDLAGQAVQLLSPPRGPFAARDAFLLAAYLLAAAEAVADPEQDGTFNEWREAVHLLPVPAKTAA